MPLEVSKIKNGRRGMKRDRRDLALLWDKLFYVFSCYLRMKNCKRDTYHGEIIPNTRHLLDPEFNSPKRQDKSSTNRVATRVTVTPLPGCAGTSESMVILPFTTASIRILCFFVKFTARGVSSFFIDVTA